jgi:hypothetical protein
MASTFQVSASFIPVRPRVDSGLLALANVVTRAVLTAPGPLNLIHAEVPNRMMGMFPFLFIPAFFVPLAVVLHMAAIQSISSGLRTAVPAGRQTQFPGP